MTLEANGPRVKHHPGSPKGGEDDRSGKRTPSSERSESLSDSDSDSDSDASLSRIAAAAAAAASARRASASYSRPNASAPISREPLISVADISATRASTRAARRRSSAAETEDSDKGDPLASSSISSSIRSRWTSDARSSTRSSSKSVSRTASATSSDSESSKDVPSSSDGSVSVFRLRSRFARSVRLFPPDADSGSGRSAGGLSAGSGSGADFFEDRLRNRSRLLRTLRSPNAEPGRDGDGASRGDDAGAGDVGASFSSPDRSSVFVPV